MSFPYTTTAVPPTNGPLPVVERASLSSGPYGGGGGGPIGPNPVVSTLTVASGAGNFIQLSNGDDTADNASLVFPLDSANTNDVQVAIDQYTSTLSVITGNGYGVLQMNFLALNSQQIGAAASGCSLQTDQFGDLIVNMPAGASIKAENRNLNISTINGAVPGGGGASIGTSSITASTINFANTSNSGLFYPADGAVVANDVGISLTPLTGQYGNTGVVGAWGKEVYQGNPGFGEFAAQRYYVADVQGGKTNQTLIQNVGNQIQIQTTSSISLQAPTFADDLNISSLSVSSINGGSLVLPNITTSSLSVSSVNGGVLPTTALYTFNEYNQGGNAATLDPKTNWLSLVNGYGQLNLLFPAAGTGGWIGNTKFWDLSQLGVASGPGGQPFASGCVIAGVSLAAVNNNTGVSQLQSWSHPGAAQLNIYASESGTVSSFSVMANITF